MAGPARCGYHPSGAERHAAFPPTLVSTPARHPSDLDLVQRLRRGESRARSEFVRRMAVVPAFLRTQTRRVGLILREEQVEELSQNVYLALWKKLAAFDGSSSIETWACGFGVFELRKWRDRTYRREREVAEVESSEEPAVPNDLGELVERSLDRLPISEEQILRLKHYEELSFTEIGDRLQMPSSSAKSLYYRALERIRPWLARAWRGEEG